MEIRNAWIKRLGALSAACLVAAAPLAGQEKKEAAVADLAAARAVFEKNLQAIRDQDRDAYLSCYLESDRLVRTGPAGFDLGYEGLAATAGQGWPAWRPRGARPSRSGTSRPPGGPPGR